eukprot:1026960-Prorocentrum_minimum.AAC.1
MIRPRVQNRVILVEGSVVEAQLNEEVCKDNKPAMVTPTFKRESKRSSGESGSPPSACRAASSCSNQLRGYMYAREPLQHDHSTSSSR